MRTFRTVLSLLSAPLLLMFVLFSPAHSGTTTPDARSTADLISYDVASAKAETLSYVVQSGDILILNLPEELGTFKVGSYTTRHAPAMSWLLERSFFWRTLGKDIGHHIIVFDALVDGIPLDRVIVDVEIR